MYAHTDCPRQKWNSIYTCTYAHVVEVRRAWSNASQLIARVQALQTHVHIHAGTHPDGIFGL